jgi:agmatinase
MKNLSRTYAGIPNEFASFEKAEVVLLPVAYDKTSTWCKGADKGPEAFLVASENMELYDIESDTEVYKNGIYLEDIVDFDGSPEDLAELIQKKTSEIICSGKLFTMIGGEHSVSIGAIKAVADKYKKISVLQLDAHSDLRPEYDGSKFNHACAMHWASQNLDLVQVGIRSMDVVEKEFLNKENLFLASEIVSIDNWQDDVINKLNEEVYLTIDLDYFDPSILPSTGTPEPGGMYWYPTLKLLEKLCKTKRIVGFDIVELAPNPSSPASDFLAAKLYYKLLTYILEK